MERRAVAFVMCAIAAAITVPVIASRSPTLGVAAAVLWFTPISWIWGRLPVALDGRLRSRPVLSAAWALSALLCIVQMARLSTFMADPFHTWGSTVPSPLVTNHLCLSSYVYAADLVRNGVGNPYDEANYPELWAKRAATERRLSDVEGLDRWIDDRFIYAPPFLLLPRAALAVTNSFDEIRSWWFVIQAFTVYVGLVLLIVWIGGPAAFTAALLIPLMLASVPTMIILQYGQFHGMTIVLVMGGMAAFQTRRPALGGTLLSAAVLSKIFPGLLGLVLITQRRWREVGWTLAAAAVIVLLAIGVLGWEPFAAFFSYHLPRLASGEAYAFMQGSDTPPLVLSRNSSIPGVVDKLRLLGMAGATRDVATIVAWLYTAALVWLAWRTARKQSRLAAVQAWLALLTLAALRAPLAPAGYVVMPTLVVLALLAYEIRGRAAVAVAFIITWALMMGTPPLPTRLDLVVNLGAQLLLVALNCWVILRREPEQVAGMRESTYSTKGL